MTKASDDDKYDMLMNKNSKLFYHLNDLLHWQLLWIQRVRHTFKADDEKGLVELQKQNWRYFIEKIIEISKDLAEGKIDENENEIVKDIIDNFKICRYFYNTLCSSVAYNFFDLVSSYDSN